MKKIKMFIPNDKTLAHGCEEYIDNCYARNLRDGTVKHYKESIQQIKMKRQYKLSNVTKDYLYRFYCILDEMIEGMTSAEKSVMLML